LPTGRMRDFYLDKNDSEHLCTILPKVFGAHRG
jgi:hypothetical protein